MSSVTVRPTTTEPAKSLRRSKRASQHRAVGFTRLLYPGRKKLPQTCPRETGPRTGAGTGLAGALAAQANTSCSARPEVQDLLKVAGPHDVARSKITAVTSSAVRPARLNSHMPSRGGPARGVVAVMPQESGRLGKGTLNKDGVFLVDCRTIYLFKGLSGRVGKVLRKKARNCLDCSVRFHKEYGTNLARRNSRREKWARKEPGGRTISNLSTALWKAKGSYTQEGVASWSWSPPMRAKKTGRLLRAPDRLVETCNREPWESPFGSSVVAASLHPGGGRISFCFHF